MQRRRRAQQEDARTGARRQGGPVGTAVVVLPSQAPSLPGGSEVDIALIDDVVNELNRLFIHKGMEMYLAMGEYICAKFFAGDVRYASRAEEHASFRALARRTDLRCTHVTIWNAVALYLQYQVLPLELRGHLGFAHQRALLSVKDPAVKVELAAAAVEQSLTENEFKVLVRESKPTSNAGRKADPPFVRKLKALRKAASSDSNRVTRGHLERLKPGRARELVEQGHQDLCNFRELLLKLEQMLAAQDVE